MKRISMIALMLSLFASTARAGMLDIDYLHPSPTKALTYSLIFPGGGYFYLSGDSPKPNSRYFSRGLLFFFGTAALTAFTISQAKKDPAGGALMGVMMLVGLRIGEFSQVTTDAEQDRHSSYKTMILSEEIEKAAARKEKELTDKQLP